MFGLSSCNCTKSAKLYFVIPYVCWSKIIPTRRIEICDQLAYA